MPSISRLFSRVFQCVKASPPRSTPWQVRYPDWAARRPFQALEGDALIKVLADFREAVRRGRSLDPDLLRHVLNCATTAPSLTVSISRAHAPDIQAAKDVLDDHTFLAAAGLGAHAEASQHHEDPWVSIAATPRAPGRAFVALAEQIRALPTANLPREREQWTLDGPMSLADVLDQMPQAWRTASRVAITRTDALSRKARQAMPAATRDVLQAMSLHLALQAQARKSGDASGAAPPDLNAVIARAVAALTRADRQALEPCLHQPLEWQGWAKSLLRSRPTGGAGTRFVQRRTVADVHVEAAVDRLRKTALEALRTPVPDRMSLTPAETKQWRHALRLAAADIRTPGRWNNLGGEVAPILMTSLRGWPKGSALQIEDTEGRVVAQFGENSEGCAPVAVQLDAQARHYSPILPGEGGRRGEVPGDGNCFFASVLAAMTPPASRELFRETRLPPSASRADLIHALRHQVADELERQLNGPRGPSEALRNAAIAHGAP